MTGTRLRCPRCKSYDVAVVWPLSDGDDYGPALMAFRVYIGRSEDAVLRCQQCGAEREVRVQVFADGIGRGVVIYGADNWVSEGGDNE